MSLLFTSSVLFAYYLLWVLAMVTPFICVLFNSKPFVDADHPLHDLFPPREWAIKIPVVFILVLLAIIGTFVSMVMIKSKRDSTNNAKQINGRRRAQRCSLYSHATHFAVHCTSLNQVSCYKDMYIRNCMGLGERIPKERVNNIIRTLLFQQNDIILLICRLPSPLQRPSCSHCRP